MTSGLGLLVFGVGVVFMIMGTIQQRRANEALEKANDPIKELNFWSETIKTFDEINSNIKKPKDDNIKEEDIDKENEVTTGKYRNDNDNEVASEEYDNKDYTVIFSE